MRPTIITTRLEWFCLVFLGGVVLAGCSGGKDKWVAGRPPVYKASGKVLYKGDPIEDAAVLYQSETGGQTARGKTNAEGKFVLSTFNETDGAIAGTHKVVITKTIYEERPTAYNSPTERAVAKFPKELLPAKYGKPQTTDLKAEITADGKNEQTFELTD